MTLGLVDPDRIGSITPFLATITWGAYRNAVAGPKALASGEDSKIDFTINRQPSRCRECVDDWFKHLL